MYIDYIDLHWDKVEKRSYLRKIPAIRGLRKLEFRNPVTFFVGENGSGKSTLLEAIAIAYGFNPEGGSLNYRFSTHDDYSDLCKALTLGRGGRNRNQGFFLRATLDLGDWSWGSRGLYAGDSLYVVGEDAVYVITLEGLDLVKTVKLPAG